MTKHFLPLVFCVIATNGFSQNPDWLTYYEKSDFKETPRYEETIDFSKQLATQSEFINYQKFGISPQGRDLPILIVDKDGHTFPVEKNKKVVVLIQACIHSGESDGKDAGLMLLRDMAIHKRNIDLLERVTLLFVPIFNVDGHEQFGPYNRINQNGPKEMGWRTTAQGLNLNRDYLKADAPEMHAMIRLYQKWLPDFYIDCHVTDGADYIYPLTYGLQMHGNLSDQQTIWLKNEYLPFVFEKMKSSGNPIAPYMDFIQWHNPKSGIREYMEMPRYSGGYAAINNRPALLIETHMLKDYKTRVEATYEMLLSSISIISTQAELLRKINTDADSATSNISDFNSKYSLTYKATESNEKFTFEGYEYTVERSEMSGGDWYQYSEVRADFEIPYYKQIADKIIKVPFAYIIPVELTEVIDKLSLHNVLFQTIESDTIVEVETYKFEEVTLKPRSFEGRVMLDYKVKPITKSITYPKGSKVVPVKQRAAQIAIHLLEPEAPDALVRWGFMNAIFEQKEYAESYVMEKMAREMLHRNPELRDELDKKKQQDKDFASNPYAILNWFYHKSPYWDNKIGVYPIGRIPNK